MKSFLQGKKTLSIAPLRIPSGFCPASGQGHAGQRGARPGATPARPGATVGEANVEVVKEGDKVVRLVVTCACGERIEVECLYPAGS
jgi:hypothetical protein